MKGLGLTILFGVVSGIANHGLFISDDLRAYDLVAAAGAMAGYPLGVLTSEAAKSAFWRAFLILVSFIVCAGCVIAYIILVQAGSANVSMVVWLGVLIAFVFGSFFYLMPLAGVVINQRSVPPG